MNDVEQAAVRAAGAVLWRPEPGSGEARVALVHRPRYDDWSLPKGKLDPGETVPAAAVREVREETGFRCVLGRRLGSAHYEVTAKDGGRAPKVVDYFAAHAGDGEFEPNSEVDELRWLPVRQAATAARYDFDRQVLARFAAAPAELTTVLLVRHAKAGKRSEWEEDDDLRPLTPAGWKQAEALRVLLPLFGPDRVFSAPRTRCEQTMRGLAEDLGVRIAFEPLLSEEGYWPAPERGLRRLSEIAAAGGTPVISSQGGVIPDVVARLAEHSGLDLAEVPSRKGSLWVLSFAAGWDDGDDDPIRLVAADYVEDPAA